MNVKSLMAASLTLLVMACAAPDEREKQLQDRLAVQILSNGTKLVTYKLRVQPVRKHQVQIYDWESNRGGFGGDIYRDEQQKRESQRFLERRLIGRMEERLAQFDVCQSGYVELERQVFLGIGTVRLECRDAASPADRKRFGERWQYPPDSASASEPVRP